MKFSQYDVISVPKNTMPDKTYDHVKITYPCTNETTKVMSIVDAIPGNVVNDVFVPLDGYEVGVPTNTYNFYKNKGKL